MDYTNTANPFANSSFGNTTTMFGASTAAGATAGNEDLNKSKRFNNWHTRQNITTPQDYPLFANQPVPFSSIPANPQVHTAATPYIQKIMTQQPGDARSLMVSDTLLVWFFCFGGAMGQWGMGRCAIGPGDGNFLRARGGVAVYGNINQCGDGVSTEYVLAMHAACLPARPNAYPMPTILARALSFIHLGSLFLTYGNM